MFKILQYEVLLTELTRLLYDFLYSCIFIRIFLYLFEVPDSLNIVPNSIVICVSKQYFMYSKCQMVVSVVHSSLLFILLAISRSSGEEVRIRLRSSCRWTYNDVC